jgi:hypothetical protein
MPYFNRCVVFSTTSTSFHGHPEPLACPEGHTRKSIALYYYSKDRPADQLGGEHNTLFKARPGEELPAPTPVETPSLAQRIKTGARLVTPPIVLEAWRRLRTGRK